MSRFVRQGLALACACALLGHPALQERAAAQVAQQRTFGAPEDAAKALIAAVKTGDVVSLSAIFGADGEELFASSDPTDRRTGRQVFTVAAAEQWHLTDEAPDRKTLVIGHEDWPFPVPIAKTASGWRFDTAAGKEEVIARRIGRNELAVIATARAYVTAQRRYAQQGHDGKPAGVYAAKLRSDPGTENGLYWPTAKGQKRSPLGDLMAQAAAEGRPMLGAQPAPFHGYYFKILTAQGSAAPGGARNYMVKGDLSGGYAMIAWPAEYDVTGVMTFLVNQDGIVREKDLGPETDAAARKLTTYNPDKSWGTSQ